MQKICQGDDTLFRIILIVIAIIESQYIPLVYMNIPHTFDVIMMNSNERMEHEESKELLDSPNLLLLHYFYSL